MIERLYHWLDHRTGCRSIISALLIEHIPGGAKWRYVWGSCLAFVFAIQLITGILLMTSYSAGDSTAWSSVYYIQYEMDFGWLIRGLHHFGSQTMVVLLGLHMLQVVIAGAHLPPREINWWLGIGLMGIVLALSLTGYLLPWDQKGYWATQVATNIARSLPGVGEWARQIIIGGPEYGHQTLTRFYALHVGILPPLLVVLMIAHIAIFRRHGVTTPAHAKGEGDGWFWPDQAFRDMVASLVIFGIMLFLVLNGHGHKTAPAEDHNGYDYWAHAGRDGRGANLDSPADPSNAYPARPEWYFLSLFQLLKYFQGDLKIVGTVVIPNGAMALLTLLPLLGYGRMRSFGHVVGVLLVTGILTGVGSLTLLAAADDSVSPLARATLTRAGKCAVPLMGISLLVVLGILAVLPRGTFRAIVRTLGMAALLAMLAGTGYVTYAAMESDHDYRAHVHEGGSPTEFADKHMPKPVAEWVRNNMKEEEKKPADDAAKFHEELDEAGKLASRAVNLAGKGVPAAGALSMLQRDPVTQGPALFQKNCAACHTHGKDFKVDKPTASDLAGFGTQEWILRLLTNPGHPEFFGRTKLTSMDEAIKTNFPHVGLKPEEVEKLNADEKKELAEEQRDLQTLARWLAAHPRNDSDEKNEEWFQEGQKVFAKRECTQCHVYEGKGGKQGPNLTGYGDEEWLRTMITMPHHPSRYGLKNTMPAFRPLLGVGSQVTKLEQARMRDLLAAQAGDDEKKLKQIEQATQVMHLDDVDREMIIRWLLKKPNTVFGGGPIAPTPAK